MSGWDHVVFLLTLMPRSNARLSVIFSNEALQVNEAAASALFLSRYATEAAELFLQRSGGIRGLHGDQE